MRFGVWRQLVLEGELQIRFGYRTCANNTVQRRVVMALLLSLCMLRSLRAVQDQAARDRKCCLLHSLPASMMSRRVDPVH